ncbi:hypothetical protein CANCADRAFT_20184, partial [Tortispora caseinolytica NRRL Y-17796]
RKTHKFRNFILLTTVLTAGTFGALTFGSLRNDRIRDIFVSTVPYAEDVVMFLEERDFQKRFPDRKRNELSNRVVVSVPRKGVQSKAVSSIEPESQVASSASSAVSATSSSPALQPAVRPPTAPATTPDLQPLELPPNGNAALSSLITTANEIIAQINATTALTKEKAAPLIAKLATVSKEIESALNSAPDLTAQISAKLDAKLKEQDAKWQTQFFEEQKHIAAAYQARLSKDIQELEKAWSAKLSNELVDAEITRQKQFMDQIVQLVEDERDGRLGQLKQLHDSLTELEKISADTSSLLDKAQRSVKLQTNVSLLQSIIYGPEPKAIQTVLYEIEKLAEDDDLIKVTVSAFPQGSYMGVLTPAQLAARFAGLEDEIRKTSLLPENAGVTAHIGSWLLSKLLFRKSGEPLGDDTESIIARTKTALSQGRVNDAVREVNSLTGWSKSLAADWLKEARQRCEVEFLTDILEQCSKVDG